jgi:bifunctional non-homologous end joining protein LigD
MNEYKDIEPAKAQRDSVSNLWENENWIADEKCDGHRYLMHFGGPCKRLYMLSRRGEEAGVCVPQFAPQVDISALGYTVLDGEVIPPEGNEFHGIASYMRVAPKAAQIQRKRAGEIKYKVFDILFLNGQDLRIFPLVDRLKILDTVMSKVFVNHPFVVPVKRAYTDTYKFFLELIDQGGEGVVLKNLKCGYGSGWIKGKRNSTVDVLVIGYEEGYDVKYGAMHVAVLKDDKVVEVGKCGILDANVRAAVNKDPLSFIGQVAELKCLKFDPVSGKVREPIFQRMRPDLSPLDATFEKLIRDTKKVNIE